MSETTVLLDPTSEAVAAGRSRREPPASLEGLTIGLLDIGKARGDVFIDGLERGMRARGLATRRYAKPTNTRVAPTALAQTVAEECDVVVEALSD